MHNSGRQSGGYFNKTNFYNAPDSINTYPPGQNRELWSLPDEFSDGTTLVETKCTISERPPCMGSGKDKTQTLITIM